MTDKTSGQTNGASRHVSSITVGGPVTPVRKKSSTSGTISSASPFGDDERHFDTSISVDNSKKETSQPIRNGKDIEEIVDPKFGTATLSRSAPVADKIQEALKERHQSVAGDITTNGNEKSEEGSSQAASDNSNEQSDDPSSSGSGMEINESAPPSSWMAFAQSLFQVKGSSSYCCAPLPQPLLQKKEKADFLASLASWVTILRIMGDLPDSDSGEKIDIAGQKPPAGARVKRHFVKKYQKKDIDDAQRKYTDLFKNPGHMDCSGVPFLSEGSGTMLEKVQFVCALGIFRPEIRDEIYCQVCKQLTNNPSRNSMVRGWVLLGLIAGSFSPTEKFAPCFLQFLKESSPEYAGRTERLLRRTFIIGTRGFPPSWLEFQAAKNSKPILLPVALMNGQRMLVEADSVTSVQELCDQVAIRTGLKEKSGFSIYITLMDRISCLGHGLHRIMDAVSECEHHTRQMGMRESNSTWRLYFRKEYFTPWHQSQTDSVSTDLVYQQVMRGISVGEYKCEKEDVLVMMAAQKFFVDHGAGGEKSKLDEFLTSWLPEESKQEHNIPYWSEKVSTALKTDLQTGTENANSLKSDIVTFAMNKWSSMFSRFYDAYKITSPATSWSNVIIGLNCKGIHVMDEKENTKIKIPFLEVATLKRARHTVTISTIKSEDIVIESYHSEDLYSLVSTFLEILKNKSKYGLVIQDCTHMEGAIGVSVQKGELIVLSQPYEKLKNSDVFSGVCKQTNKQETMPRDILYILPVTEEPSKDTMGMLTVQLRHSNCPLVTLASEHVEEHNLLNYSKIHFRPSNENRVSNRVSKILTKASLKKDKHSQLWSFSKDTLKKPLLKKTMAREDLRRTCLKCATGIQIFMGDGGHKEQTADLNIADELVLEPSMRSRHMREEVYCQLIKQLTHNPDRSSEDNGWNLLFMLATTTLPGSELFEECELFMKGSNHRMAKSCLERFKKTKREGFRQYGPHPKEYEALLGKKLTMDFDVMLPFQAHEMVSVHSEDRVHDVKLKLLEQLKISTHLSAEYGLFFGLRDRVLSAKDGDYFMDALTHVERFWSQHNGNRRPSESAATIDKVTRTFLMKKLWVNAEPGIDSVADSVFHFPQELPNYLRGFHPTHDADVGKLAAYIYRGQFGDDMTGMINFKENLSALVPRSTVKQKSVEQWKENIEMNLKLTKNISSEEAKLAFLKTVKEWPTYGSVFFEVKQRTLKNLPKHVLVGVNSKGVLLMDPDSKEILSSYEFNQIPNWAYDEYSFTLVVGESSSGASKIHMETSVGHNMDDIIMSYVSWMMNTHIKKRPHYSGVTVGESLC